MRKPWENVTVKIIYTEVVPYMEEVGDGVTPKGLQGSLFTNITESMKLQWERVKVPFDGWGQCFNNGTCIGQLAPIVEGVADIALGPFIMSPEVDNAMQVWAPSMVSEFSIVSGFPSPFRNPGPFAFFQTLSLLLWCVLILCLIILPLISWLLYPDGDDTEIEATLLDHFTVFFATLLQESSSQIVLQYTLIASSIRFRSTTLRIMMAGWILGAFVVSSFTSATLKSVMSVRQPAPRIDSLHDAFAQDPRKYKLMVMEATGLFELLREAEYPLFRKAADFVEKTHGLLPIMEYVTSIEMIRDFERGRHSLIVPCKQAVQWFYSSDERAKGAVGYVCCSEPVLLMLLGWVTAKHADDLHQLIFLEMERRLQWIMESPFPRQRHYESAPPRLFQRFVPRTGFVDSELTTVAPLSLSQVGGAFVLLGICALFSIITLILELINKRLFARRAAVSTVDPSQYPRRGWLVPLNSLFNSH